MLQKDKHSGMIIIQVEYVDGVADETRKVVWGQIMEGWLSSQREQTLLQATRSYWAISKAGSDKS